MMKLKDWLALVTRDQDSWEGNNLHIDEITGFLEVDRSAWLNSSIELFKGDLESPSDFIVFLHIELADEISDNMPPVISQKWIQESLNEFTPPSFNCCSMNYYNQFYIRILSPGNVDEHLERSLGGQSNFIFFHRIGFDETEQAYSRELYIFKRE